MAYFVLSFVTGQKISMRHTFKNSVFSALHLCFLTQKYDKNIFTIQCHLYGSIELVKGYNMAYFVLSFVTGQKFSTSHTFKNSDFSSIHLCFLTQKYDKNIFTTECHLYGSIELVEGYNMAYFVLSFVTGQKFSMRHTF